MLPMRPAPAFPGAAAVWQNPQAAPMFPGSEFTAFGAAPAKAPVGQVPSWGPNMQASKTTFVSVPRTFPGQIYGSSSVPAYPTAATPSGPAHLMQTDQMSPTVPPMGASHPAHQRNVQPGGASPPGQLPYYGQ